MPTYRLDVETDQSTVHQYVFQSDQILRAGPLLSTDPVLSEPLHGTGAPHTAAVDSSCPCSVLITTTPRRELGPDGALRHNDAVDVEGRPAPSHTWRHAETLEDVINYVESDGRYVTAVTLIQLTDRRAAWRTN